MNFILKLLTLILGMFQKKSVIAPINFKTARNKKEWQLLRDKNNLLFKMIEEVADFAKDKFNKRIVITSVLRLKKEQIDLHGFAKPSPHMYWRAVDLRSWIFTPEENSSIVEYINSRYIYDPNRPALKCCVFHKIKGNVYHFHFQVHPSTQKINK